MTQDTLGALGGGNLGYASGEQYECYPSRVALTRPSKASDSATKTSAGKTGRNAIFAALARQAPLCGSSGSSNLRALRKFSVVMG